MTISEHVRPAQTIQGWRRSGQKNKRKGPLKNETSFHTPRPSSCHREENLGEEGPPENLHPFVISVPYPPPLPSSTPREIPWICLLKVTDPPLGYIAPEKKGNRRNTWSFFSS
ncbi:hypothetical protein NPIL_565241 [Nephila pilipes]|uniref:Uncharacterized protein n=1 Tax=Nephila pilipes TaxID=299642 RepID=A0A8X6UUW1_NEPPI|nr:hypothetical protein NPIL_565241 [Nephila pilipes]